MPLRQLQSSAPDAPTPFSPGPLTPLRYLQCAAAAEVLIRDLLFVLTETLTVKLHLRLFTDVVQ